MLARSAAPHAHHMSAIGHAHIDSAWLWPLRETRRKCARTFSSAVTLMDTYPEYRFACSQAAQYSWIEHDHPELFERIRAKVAEGRFVPVGSMWVEADANLPSGESLARQFVWGKRYFADRFGVDTREVWIPDVFGYAGNLPQLMAQAGCEYFLTQKLSWNTTNDFPHHTFWWEGIDGTRIFTHFPPADTYNGEVVPRELVYGVRNFRDKGRATRSMYLFGHGDGGGGPTREMLERARRCTAPRERPRRLAPPHHRGAGRLLPAAEAEYPDAPGVAGRALPGDAPRHLHHPGPHQVGQPAGRAGPARARAVDRARRRSRPSPTSSGCGRCCCCTSSTTSSPARPSPGSTTTPRPPTPRCWPRSRTASPPPSRRADPTRPTVPGREETCRGGVCPRPRRGGGGERGSVRLRRRGRTWTASRRGSTRRRTGSAPSPPTRPWA